MAVFLGQFHRRIAGSRSWYLIEIKDLIKAQPEDFPDHWRNLPERPVHIAAQDPVQRIAGLHRPIDQLRHKTAVCIIEVGLAQLPRQCHIGIGTILVHFIHDLYRGITRFIHSYSFPFGIMIRSSWRRTSAISTCVL